MFESRNLFKILLSAVLIVISAGCSKPTKQGREMADGIALLRRGMTNSEVTDLLGSPTSTFQTEGQVSALLFNALGNVGVNWTYLEVADFNTTSFDWMNVVGQPSEFLVYEFPNELLLCLHIKGGHLLSAGPAIANSKFDEYASLHGKVKESEKEGKAP